MPTAPRANVARSATTLKVSLSRSSSWDRKARLTRSPCRVWKPVRMAAATTRLSSHATTSVPPEMTCTLAGSLGAAPPSSASRGHGNLATGVASPVSEASTTFTPPFKRIASHGVGPSSTSMMSPGTISAASRDVHAPPRKTFTFFGHAKDCRSRSKARRREKAVCPSKKMMLGRLKSATKPSPSAAQKAKLNISNIDTGRSKRWQTILHSGGTGIRKSFLLKHPFR
mmetsp:Transcript_26309/g.60709  ORF Transcript_26309/g.60709 Transcript_26309/m.60709 type:complete len:227 (+) Transcript_26309:1510-2190(+)